jgi:hypothetical protein
MLIIDFERRLAAAEPKNEKSPIQKSKHLVSEFL